MKKTNISFHYRSLNSVLSVTEKKCCCCQHELWWFFCQQGRFVCLLIRYSFLQMLRSELSIDDGDGDDDDGYQNHSVRVCVSDKPTKTTAAAAATTIMSPRVPIECIAQQTRRASERVCIRSKALDCCPNHDHDHGRLRRQR